jgi:hypothetical protein
VVTVHLPRPRIWLKYLVVAAICLAAWQDVLGQDDGGEDTEAGYVPVISGGAGYIHNVNGGVTTLEPQINPVLLVAFGRHVLLESRTDFTGVFQRENQTSGPYKGKVFTTVEYSQLDWLASTRVTAVAGRYLLPFGLYNERLEPIWIKNLQDPPITASIGTRTSGAGDGLLLRGVAMQGLKMSVQYSAYFSALCGIEQLTSARTAGGDASVFLNRPRLEIGTSWQRFLQGHQINNSGTYVSWQPGAAAFDLKAEYDYSFYGQGYWAETAYRLEHTPVPPFFKRFQAVGRMQQVFPKNGGGNGLPSVRTERVDFGANYYLRDNLRLLSSYGRTFSSNRNANIWNLGFTYKFTIPLWYGGRK